MADTIEFWLPEYPPMHHEDLKRTIFGKQHGLILDDTTAITMVEVYKAALRLSDRNRRPVGNKWLVNFFIRGRDFGRKTLGGQFIVLYQCSLRLPCDIDGNCTGQIQPPAQRPFSNQRMPGPSYTPSRFNSNADAFIPRQISTITGNGRTAHSPKRDVPLSGRASRISPSPGWDMSSFGRSPRTSSKSTWPYFPFGTTQPAVVARLMPPSPKPYEGSVTAGIMDKSMSCNRGFRRFAQSPGSTYKPNEAYAELLEGSVEDTSPLSKDSVDARYGVIGDPYPILLPSDLFMDDLFKEPF